MENLAEIPTEEVEVVSKPTSAKTKIGEEDFVNELANLVSRGPTWRTAKTMAEKLAVDPVDLSDWLDKRPEILRRPGKEDGIVYYALATRLESKEQKRPPGMDRKQITEEDRYLVASFHMIYKNLSNTLEKYGLRAFERNEEGFKALVNSRDRLSAGLALLINATHADVDRLPDL